MDPLVEAAHKQLVSDSSLEYTDSEDDHFNPRPTLHVSVDDEPKSQDKALPFHHRRVQSLTARKRIAHKDAEIRELKRQLTERESASALAAEVGQQLLKEIDQIRLANKLASDRIAELELLIDPALLHPQRKMLEAAAVDRLRGIQAEYEKAAATMNIPVPSGVAARQRAIDPHDSNELNAPHVAAALRAPFGDGNVQKDLFSAAELSASLLQQVKAFYLRLLQIDDDRHVLEAQVAEQARELELLKQQVKRNAEQEEKHQEVTWDLELANQELRNQVHELQNALNKTTYELSKSQQNAQTLRENIELLQEREKDALAQLEKSKQKYETDMNSMRKNVSTLQREKSDLEKRIESLEKELEASTSRATALKASEAANIEKIADLENQLESTTAENEKTAALYSQAAEEKDQLQTMLHETQEELVKLQQDNLMSLNNETSKTDNEDDDDDRSRRRRRGRGRSASRSSRSRNGRAPRPETPPPMPVITRDLMQELADSEAQADNSMNALQCSNCGHFYNDSRSIDTSFTLADTSIESSSNFGDKLKKGGLLAAAGLAAVAAAPVLLAGGGAAAIGGLAAAGATAVMKGVKRGDGSGGAEDIEGGDNIVESEGLREAQPVTIPSEPKKEMVDAESQWTAEEHLSDSSTQWSYDDFSASETIATQWDAEDAQVPSPIEVETQWDDKDAQIPLPVEIETQWNAEDAQISPPVEMETQWDDKDAQVIPPVEIETQWLREDAGLGPLPIFAEAGSQREAASTEMGTQWTNEDAGEPEVVLENVARDLPEPPVVERAELSVQTDELSHEDHANMMGISPALLTAAFLKKHTDLEIAEKDTQTEITSYVDAQAQATVSAEESSVQTEIVSFDAEVQVVVNIEERSMQTEIVETADQSEQCVPDDFVSNFNLSPIMDQDRASSRDATMLAQRLSGFGIDEEDLNRLGMDDDAEEEATTLLLLGESAKARRMSTYSSEAVPNDRIDVDSIPVDILNENTPVWKREAILNPTHNNRDSKFLLLKGGDEVPEDKEERLTHRLSHVSMISGITVPLPRETDPKLATIVSDRSIAEERPPQDKGKAPVHYNTVGTQTDRYTRGLPSIGEAPEIPTRPKTRPPTILLVKSGQAAPVLIRPTEEGGSISDTAPEKVSENTEVRKSVYPPTVIGDLGDGRAVTSPEFKPSRPVAANFSSARALTPEKPIVEKPTRPVTAAAATSGSGMSATDPLIIQAITQTMIGDHLWKYTRRVGGGTSEKKHRRFFWIHPYTKTIYWSTKSPGADGNTMRDATAKSARIKSVRVALDSAQTDGQSSYILIVSTPGREIKLRAENDDRHAVWLRALSYLQSRPATNGLSAPASSQEAPGQMRAWTSDRADSEEELDNIRACCGGKHDVGALCTA